MSTKVAASRSKKVEVTKDEVKPEPVVEVKPEVVENDNEDAEKSEKVTFDELIESFLDKYKEVRAGLECGIRLGDYSEYEVGDIIECYTLEKVAQTL